MTKPTLLILSFSPIAADARVLKQVVEFRDDFDVTTCGYGDAPDGVVEHLRIPDDALSWRFPRALVIARQYRRAYEGNEAVRAARAMLRGREFDVILADDVETLGVATEVRSRGGVHADLHEYSPRQHEEDWKFRLFLQPFIEWMVRTHVRQASSWSTVSTGLAREYNRVFGFRPSIVTNAAPYANTAPTPVHDPIRLVHSGACLRNRNLDTLIEAVIAAKRTVTLDFYLTENDSVYLAELRARAKKHSERIRINPPVPYAKLSETLNRFDVGVHVLPPINFNNNWALPNKLFDYVQARLGVIIGPSPEMAQYVEQFEIGAVSAGFTAKELTQVIDRLDPEIVHGWKAQSAANAHALSSETQVLEWRRLVEALVPSET